MKNFISISFHILLAFILALATSNLQMAMAQDHVVAPSSIQRDVAAASSAREKNQEQLETFVSSPQAAQALKTVHLNVNQVKNALPNLSNEEMAQLAARSQGAQADFAAGRISDRDLIFILLGIVALILIIVAVR